MNILSGSFLCASCKNFGPWSTLERFVKMNKNEKKHTEELKMLLQSLQLLKSYNKEWDEIKNRSDPVSQLSVEMFEQVVNRFLLPVSILTNLFISSFDKILSLNFILLYFFSSRKQELYKFTVFFVNLQNIFSKITRFFVILQNLLQNSFCKNIEFSENLQNYYYLQIL